MKASGSGVATTRAALTPTNRGKPMVDATYKLSHSAIEALDRATTGQSLTNYPAIFAGFMAEGIAEVDIKPRENVFTFEAWKALGRSVKKGERGVKVVTFI